MEPFFVSGYTDGELGSKFDATRSCSKNSCLKKADAIGQFEKFTKSGLQRLDLVPLEDMDVVKIWKQNEPFMVCCCQSR